MNKMSKIIAVLAMIISITGIAYVAQHNNNEVHYGFVNTEKLLNSFVESQKALDEVKQAEEVEYRTSCYRRFFEGFRTALG